MRPAVICTMPRSGTWYTYYFLEFFNSFYAPADVPIGMQHHYEEYPNLGFKKFHNHTIFPGFIEDYDGPHRAAWEQLAFHHAGANFAYDEIAARAGEFYPSLNPDARVAYMYRNPLDQCVSLFHHQRESAAETTGAAVLRYEDADGTHTIETPSVFLRKKGIDSYIKHYFTFAAMRPKFPGQCLMLSYERVRQDPATAFAELLRFLGFEESGPRVDEAMRLALQFSSMPAMRRFEKQLGRSLANDRAVPGMSHMHGGGVGKWRRLLSADDVAFAEDRLAAFGLKLADFEIG